MLFGQYIFTDLTEGNYLVQFEYPSGFDVASMPKQLAAGQTNSDPTDSDGFRRELKRPTNHRD